DHHDHGRDNVRDHALPRAGRRDAARSRRGCARLDLRTRPRTRVDTMVNDPGASEYAASSALLAAHLNARRFGDGRFLDWFYGANPPGRAIVEEIDDVQGPRLRTH